MTEAMYSHDQIKDHWKDYKSINWYKFLKNGKTIVRTTVPNTATESIQKLEMAKASSLVSFPKYLDIVNGGS